MRSDHPHRQRGQVLPLATLLLLAVAATLFYMFNGGQLVQEKLRLTNTADAVAYSAGVFEARMLNYDAYANRAIIANQIAIGQAVGRNPIPIIIPCHRVVARHGLGGYSGWGGVEDKAWLLALEGAIPAREV